MILSLVLTASILGVIVAKLLIWWFRFPNIFRIPVSRDVESDTHRIGIDVTVEAVTPYTKNPISTDNQPRKHYETIVIGSGISGLACAQLLKRAFEPNQRTERAQNGNCLLLEQHDTFGGCLHTWHDKGFEFDTGFHYAGALGGCHVNQFLLESLGVHPERLVSNGDVWDRVVIGEPGPDQRVYEMRSGFQQWRNQMVNYFPTEMHAIDEFLRLTKIVADSTPPYVVLKMLPSFFTPLFSAVFAKSYFLYAEVSATDVVHSLTTNEDLRHCLLYAYGDVSITPETPFTVLASVYKHFISHGSFYPEGGSQMIASDILKDFTDEHNHAFTQVAVEEILINKTTGAAYGVKLVTGERIHARTVISSAGVKNTFQKLIPLNNRLYDALSSSASKFETGAAHLSVFLGFNKSEVELQFPKYNVWVSPDAHTKDDARAYLAAKDPLTAKIPLIFFSFPSAKDPQFAVRHPHKSVALLLFPVKYEWFDQWKDQRVKHREGEYEFLKQELAQRAIDLFHKMYPQSKDCVEYVSVATPLSSQYYLASDKGSSYGLNPSTAREARNMIRTKTMVPNLYLTGQDIFSSCGFVSALMSSILTCSAVTGRILFADMGLEHSKWKQKRMFRKV